MNDGSNWSYMLQDGLGSVRAEIGANVAVNGSQSYTPYGEVFGASGAMSSPFAFTGEPLDGNGLQYHRARYMNPALGGFLSLDPFEGVYSRPMSLNGYSWAEGNVVNGIDPAGEQTCLPPMVASALSASSGAGTITSGCRRYCERQGSYYFIGFDQTQCESNCLAESNSATQAVLDSTVVLTFVGTSPGCNNFTDISNDYSGAKNCIHTATDASLSLGNVVSGGIITHDHYAQPRDVGDSYQHIKSTYSAIQISGANNTDIVDVASLPTQTKTEAQRYGIGTTFIPLPSRTLKKPRRCLDLCDFAVIIMDNST